ncbi:MAG: DVU0298 family protein [Thermodesulfobacteriota bacterium]
MNLLKILKTFLEREDYTALLQTAQGNEGKTAGGLIGLLTDSDERIKWRAVKALGLVVGFLFARDPERVRTIIRQLIWNLNDESGGIGWGMPEALGEILAEIPALRSEYLGLFIAYLTEAKCRLDNPQLLAGVIWGIGRIKQLDEETKQRVLPYLLGAINDQSSLLQGTVVWTLGRLKAKEAFFYLKTLQKEKRMVKIFSDGQVKEQSIGQWAQEARANIIKGG